MIGLSAQNAPPATPSTGGHILGPATCFDRSALSTRWTSGSRRWWLRQCCEPPSRPCRRTDRMRARAPCLKTPPSRRACLASRVRADISGRVAARRVRERDARAPSVRRGPRASRARAGRAAEVRVGHRGAGDAHVERYPRRDVDEALVERRVGGGVAAPGEVRLVEVARGSGREEGKGEDDHLRAANRTSGIRENTASTFVGVVSSAVRQAVLHRKRRDPQSSLSVDRQFSLLTLEQEGALALRPQ